MDKPIPILVVSSEFKNRYALKEILSREGWKTISASTVGECEEVLANQKTDLVFCDRGLTDGSYRDILAIARSLGRNARLVVTSRLADWGEYLEALQDGAFDLIASPSQKADVVRVINQAQREDQKTSMPVAAGKALKAAAGSPF
jgi:DNA-binding NtrC family response regulator